MKSDFAKKDCLLGEETSPWPAPEKGRVSSEPLPYALVLGTSYSGSGAIFDYLVQRSEVYDPLDGKEYLLPHAPGGLNALEYAIGPGFHPSTTSLAASNFLETVAYLDREPNLLKGGFGYSVPLPDFRSACEELVKQLCVSSFSYKSYVDRFSRNPRLHRSLFTKSDKDNSGIRWLPRDHTSFIALTKEFHNRLFQPRPGTFSLVCLNQAGSGWNPDSVRNLFDTPRPVVVTRDPRDQFAELKEFKKGQNVRQFVSWYREMNRRIESSEGPFLRIPFEDWAIDNQFERGNLETYLGLPKSEVPATMLKQSRENVGVYSSILSKQERTLLEKELVGYLNPLVR